MITTRLARHAAAATFALILTAGAMAQDSTGKQENAGLATYLESVSHRLEQSEVDKILSQAEAATSSVASGVGLRSTDSKKRPGRFHIVVVDRKGREISGRFQTDAWVGSIDIAVAKARTAAFFSSNENALTSRDIGKLSQPGGPLWGIGNTNKGDSTDRGSGIIKNALVTFPGGVPLYKDGKLVGAIGVSGDGVDQDEAIAFAGAQGFLPAGEVGHVSELKAPEVDKLPK